MSLCHSITASSTALIECSELAKIYGLFIHIKKQVKNKNEKKVSLKEKNFNFGMKFNEFIYQYSFMFKVDK